MRFIIPLIVLFFFNCSEGEDETSKTDAGGQDETDVDSETETESDADTNTATDTNTDTDTDTDTDTGSDLEPIVPENLIDKAFVFDIKPTDRIQPPGVAAEVGAYIPRLLFQINTINENNLKLLLGTATEADVQDLCNETRVLNGYLNQNPQFRLGPSDLPTIIKDNGVVISATIYDTAFTGAFVAQGAAIDSPVASAILDVREIYQVIDTTPDATPERVCEQIASSGASCEACLTDYENYCLWMRAEGFAVREVTGIEFDEVDEADIDKSCYEL